MSASRRERSIVVFNMNFIGDVLFTTPAIAALRRGYSDAEITVVVGPRAREVLAADPNVTRLVELPPRYSDKWAALRALRTHRFGPSVSFSSRDMERVVWAWLLGCRPRWGYCRPEMRPFITGGIREEPDRHWVDEYLSLACLAGGREDGRLPRAYLTPAEEAWAEGYVTRLLPEGKGSLLGLHVGASYGENAWRRERFAELARIALREGVAGVVAFGGQSEADAGVWLASQVPGTENLAGELSLRQFMAVARRCSAFVGGDSGPTHLAAALAVPTVALYGFSNPARTGVVGERTARLGRGGNWDSRAQRRQESPHQWLDPITAEEVWGEVCRLVAS